MLLNVILQVDIKVSWWWIHDLVVGYTVSSAYRVLTSRLPTTMHVPAAVLWRKDVPLKVSVFVWRLFQNMLSSKTNLLHRGIIPYEASLCVSGCGQQESETHLFLSCHFFGQLWQLVRNWFGVYSADLSNIVDHFYQFATSSGYGKSRCSLMHLIWCACLWVLWKERNDRLFNSKENSPIRLLKNVKILSFWWFKAKFVNFFYGFHNWCQTPFLCVGIG